MLYIIKYLKLNYNFINIFSMYHKSQLIFINYLLFTNLMKLFFKIFIIKFYLIKFNIYYKF